MGLIEMPSLILQLGRVRCTLHEREGLPSNCLICVPGMSDGNDKLPSSHDIVMRLGSGWGDILIYFVDSVFDW